MMTRAAWIGLVVGVAVLVGAYVYVFRDDDELVAEPAAEPAAPPAAAVAEIPAAGAEEPVIEHPMPAPSPGEQLPPLEESDDAAMQSLRELFGTQPLESFLIPREILRRVVLAIDSLDREPLPLWLRPVRRVPGALAVETSGGGLALKPANAARYAPLVETFAAVDANKLAAVYRRYYPLLQDAYDRLGNPRTPYFNDRLIEIIDHLLDTPVVEEPVALVRPKVLYQFADPALEQCSSGQKTLLRMGRENAARVQAKLREIRTAIMALPATKGAGVTP